ncbi:MAG: hypothetical protein ACMZI0_09395 [Symbiopectobacterium sp.]|uniref:hypothetical protein n=1 Tax=Symbiopectobacterium sp. TaxID=2952789 RepID=UPI0039E76F0A
MNSFDLSLLKYIQGHSPVLIEDVMSKFGKTTSTLKRSLKGINEFLEPEYHLHIDGQSIVTAITYRQYIDFLEQIPFNRYITTAEERIKCLSVALCLHDVVNKSEYYRRFNVSSTTLKNDNPALTAFLQANHLSVTAILQQGSCLEGDEILLRIAICLTILKTVEIGDDNLLVLHKANEPINKAIATQFLKECQQEITSAAHLYQQLSHRVTLGYNSKKYFLVYMSIALHRMRRGHVIAHSDDLGFIQSFNFSARPRS